MAMFDQETTAQLTGILSDMVEPVHIVFFKGNNEKSKETESFLKEFVEFSPKLHLEVNDIDSPEAKNWNAKVSPILWVTTPDYSLKGVGFYGTPGGYEINSFLMSILEVSGKVESLTPQYKEIVDAINKPLEIYVYVSLTCPQCPQAVMNAHRLAVENHHIHAYMVEGPAFKEYAEKYGVQAFPHMIIGEKQAELVGENAKDMNQLILALKEF